MKYQTEKLLPIPTIMNEGWNGYHHFKDPTRLTVSDLVYPSKNCFVPSKDKVVPRMGKTILGQRASYSNPDIDFGDFTYGEKETGEITYNDRNLLPSTNNPENTTAKVDETHVIGFFNDESNMGVATVYEISEDPKDVKLISALRYEENNITNAKYNSCLRLKELDGYAYFVNFWRGKGLVKLYINEDTISGSFGVGDEIQGGTSNARGIIKSVGGDWNNELIVEITNNNDFLDNESVSTSSASGTIYKLEGGTQIGKVQVFKVDLTTFSIYTAGDITEFGSSSGYYNSCARIDDTHVLNFWTTGTLGYVQTFSIDGSYDISAIGSPLNYYAGATFYNSCAVIDANHVINFWNASIKGYARMFSIDLGTYAISAIGSNLEFESSAVFTNSCALVDSTHVINFWQNGELKSYCRVFSLNVGTGAITAMDSAYMFNDSEGVISSNSCVSLENSKSFINFWKEEDTLKSQIFNVNVSTGKITALLTPKVYSWNSTDNYSYNSCVYLGNNNVVNFTGKAVAYFSVLFSIEEIILSVACPGKNRALWVGITIKNTGDGDKITSVKYGDVEMTQAFKVALDSNNERYFYYLINPKINYNNLVIKTNPISENIKVGASSYSNVVQSNPTIISQSGPSAGTSISISETPIVDKSWIIAMFSAGVDYESGLTQGENTVFRGGNNNFQMADSGSEISPAELTTLSASFESSNTAVAFAAVMAPIGGTSTREDWKIIGNKKRYSTDGGYTTEVRVTRTDSDSLRDIIEVLLKDPTTNKYKWYQITENANPLEQGNAPRYYMDEFFDTNTNPSISRNNSRLIWTNGTRNIFSWSGGINLVSEVVNNIYIKGEANKSWISQGFFKYLNPNNQETRYITVGGRKYKIENKGYYITLSSIVGEFEDGETVTGGTSGATGKVATVFGESVLVYDVVGTFQAEEEITGGTSGATANILASSVSSGIETDALFIESTAGISVNDYAFSRIYPPNSTDIFYQDVLKLADTYPNIDYCRQNKGYMYYGSFSSKQLFQSNAFNRVAVEKLSIKSDAQNYGVMIIPSTPDFDGSSRMIFTVTIEDGTSEDGYIASFKYSYRGVDYTGGRFDVVPNQKYFLNTPYGGLSVIFTSDTYGLGSTWMIDASPAIGDAQYLGDISTPQSWANFYYDLPRIPGQGYIYNLPANFFAMAPQENNMYTCDKYGQWGYVETILGDDLATEKVSWTPLKQTASSKPIQPYMLGYMENYIVYVTENKTLDFIGRKEFLELPQMDYLSQDIALDFEECSFEDGSIEYLNKMLYITSPKDVAMLVFDNRTGNKFWQPIQTYSENSILSIVDNVLISHSNILNQTFNLFTGNDDDGAEFEVIIRTGFSDGSVGRWKNKFSNNTFVEGYIEGNPELLYTILRAPNDQEGITHKVIPIKTDLPPDNSSLGKSVLGINPLGGDKSMNGTYFQEIYNKIAPILNYYFIAFQLSCTSKNHSYEILSLGVNMAIAPTGNNNLIGDKTLD